MHDFFFFPGPPNFFMSLQYAQLPHSPVQSIAGPLKNLAYCVTRGCIELRTGIPTVLVQTLQRDSFLKKLIRISTRFVLYVTVA